MSTNNDLSAVILCGGRGRRLGSLGEQLPKAMAQILGQPILWYTVLRLHMAGIRHFVFPLGYRGEVIRWFLADRFANIGARIDAIDTGEDTDIGNRLHQVRDLISDSGLLLVNGDTLFDFDIPEMISEHREHGAKLTISTCDVISQYGLVTINSNGTITDFSRNQAISAFVIPTTGGEPETGYVNAGISVLSKSILDMPHLETTPEFEQFVYPQVIGAGSAHHFHIDGFWHAIDTQKDLETANAGLEQGPRAAGAYRLAEMLQQYERGL